MDLSSLTTAIDGILQDGAYTEEVIVSRINAKVQHIAAGVMLPDRSLSPPLPDLMDYATVTTTTLAYVALPSDYQRNVFLVLDSSGVKIDPPPGGDYYAFQLFLRSIADMRLSESGSVYRVAVKGKNLYYQGIPSTAETIGLHFYRKPATLALDGDEPEGIPEQLQERLIVHGVLADIYGSQIEDGLDNAGKGAAFHSGKFMEAVLELTEFIGTDAGPQYYGSGGFMDLGVCD